MPDSYIKRFCKHPWFYLKNYKRTFKVIGEMIKGTQWYQSYLYGEHRRMYGFRNSDKTFYVICPSASTQGLFSIHNYVLWKIKYALDHGYVPVVDYKNYDNMYLDPELVGKVNAWEYYFKQPAGYGIEEVKKSKNVIICDKFLPAGYKGLGG